MNRKRICDLKIGDVIFFYSLPMTLYLFKIKRINMYNSGTVAISVQYYDFQNREQEFFINIPNWETQKFCATVLGSESIVSSNMVDLITRIKVPRHFEVYIGCLVCNILDWETLKTLLFKNPKLLYSFSMHIFFFHKNNIPIN